MKEFTCIIIEDEAPARELLKRYLLDFPNANLCCECSDGFEGLKAIQQYKPDLVILDIQMPKISGLELVELIDDLPLLLFTTAFQEHAIKAFELNAIDYLLKPFTKSRFIQALEKVQLKINQQVNESSQLKNVLLQTQPSTIERIVVKTNTAIKVISLEEIFYIEAQDDYVYIHTEKEKFLKQQTMKQLEAGLPEQHFLRIHRSFMINLNNIVKIEPFEKTTYQAILKNKAKVPISRSGYSILKKVLDF